MKPSIVSAQLRQIASKIDASKRPDKNLVAADLERLVRKIRSHITVASGMEPKLEEQTFAIESLWPDGTNLVQYDVSIGESILNPGGYSIVAKFVKSGGTGNSVAGDEFEINFSSGIENNMEEARYLSGKEPSPEFTEYIYTKVDSQIHDLIDPWLKEELEYASS